MDIENLSIDEALIIALVQDSSVDATNVIPLLRAAQAKIIEYTGARDPEEVVQYLASTRTIGEVGSIIALVSEGGTIDLFRD